MSNSEKIAVALTVPALVVTLAKPLTKPPGAVETYFLVAPGGSINVKTLEVVVDPVSSVNVIRHDEPADMGSLLSWVKVIAPVAFPEDAGVVRRIVVFQVVVPSIPFTTWG